MTNPNAAARMAKVRKENTMTTPNQAAQPLWSDERIFDLIRDDSPSSFSPAVNVAFRLRDEYEVVLAAKDERIAELMSAIHGLNQLVNGAFAEVDTLRANIAELEAMRGAGEWLPVENGFYNTDDSDLLHVTGSIIALHNELGKSQVFLPQDIRLCRFTTIRRVPPTE